MSERTDAEWLALAAKLPNPEKLSEEEYIKQFYGVIGDLPVKDLPKLVAACRKLGRKAAPGSPNQSQ